LKKIKLADRRHGPTRLIVNDIAALAGSWQRKTMLRCVSAGATRLRAHAWMASGAQRPIYGLTGLCESSGTKDMNFFKMIALVVASAALAAMVGLAAAQQTEAKDKDQNPWGACCGMQPWRMGPMMGHGMMGHGMMRHGMRGHGMMGSMRRHHQARMSGVPAPYDSLKNPLPQTRETVDRGAAVYEQKCASCHGQTGQGDGEAGRNLSPPPANLAWLSQMPIAQWDPFMYWTVAEGGKQFETAMPAFKDTLSADDIWSVIAYIQARLPRKAKAE
jgi:mono/diheme cytochrome c family protein